MDETVLVASVHVVIENMEIWSDLIKEIELVFASHGVKCLTVQPIVENNRFVSEFVSETVSETVSE